MSDKIEKGIGPKKTDEDTIKETVQKIKLTGINIADLINATLLKKMNEKGLKVKPFLIAMEINGETIISIGHREPADMDNKIIYIESKPSASKKSYVNEVTDALKTMSE